MEKSLNELLFAPRPPDKGVVGAEVFLGPNMLKLIPDPVGVLVVALFVLFPPLPFP